MGDLASATFSAALYALSRSPSTGTKGGPGNEQTIQHGKPNVARESQVSSEATSHTTPYLSSEELHHVLRSPLLAAQQIDLHCAHQHPAPHDLRVQVKREGVVPQCTGKTNDVDMKAA